jgi:hypothetical protein
VGRRSTEGMMKPRKMYPTKYYSLIIGPCGDFWCFFMQDERI